MFGTQEFDVKVGAFTAFKASQFSSILESHRPTLSQCVETCLRILWCLTS